MNEPNADWERRVAAVWQAMDGLGEAEFIARVEALAAELPSDHAIGLFERGCAQDSTGHSDLAVPLYKAALHQGLGGIRRRRAVIQMSSSLRNTGHADKAVTLLTAELELPSDELDGAVRGVLALALADVGREREAVSHALTALSFYLPRYNRSMARYAQALLEKK
ncbi:hypothetical protein BWI17_17240 [Betaproteobacteria bacterium GR16-43]|nr:hypothetical protein BWI17_17240 [Betaproteobacteria bacterium GR16-43]